MGGVWRRVRWRSRGRTQEFLNRVREPRQHREMRISSIVDGAKACLPGGPEEKHTGLKGAHERQLLLGCCVFYRGAPRRWPALIRLHKHIQTVFEPCDREAHVIGHVVLEKEHPKLGCGCKASAKPRRRV